VLFFLVLFNSEGTVGTRVSSPTLNIRGTFCTMATRAAPHILSSLDVSLSANPSSTFLSHQRTSPKHHPEPQQHLRLTPITKPNQLPYVFHLTALPIKRSFKDLFSHIFKHIESPQNNKAHRLDFLIHIFCNHFFGYPHAEPSRACAQLLSHGNRRLIWQTQ
jgi:hypothetical protein